MNGKQPGKFSSAEDRHKQKYMQKSLGDTSFDSPGIGPNFNRLIYS